MSSNRISIRGARVHNLKNVSLELPREKMIVITGLSGSGKSSLAFDTIYAEGQRRYVESLSSYARQFLGMMDKPDVDQIEGLSPAISIDQRSTSRNPRSTVGTITEIYDYLRLLYARVGHPHCPNCGREVVQQTRTQILDKISAFPSGTKLNLIAPLIRDKKGEHKKELEEIRRAGYSRVRVDGTAMTIEEAAEKTLDPKKKHTIDVVIDRLVTGPQASKTRMADSLETALDLGNGMVILEEVTEKGNGKEHMYSELFACPSCGLSLAEIAPRSFSFNSPHGACPDCTGLGNHLKVDPDLVMPNKRLSISEGAVRPWASSASHQTWFSRILSTAARKHGFSVDVPAAKLTKKQLDLVFYGTGDETYFVQDPAAEGKVQSFTTTFEGVIPNLERRYHETESDYIRREIERYMIKMECPTCKGKRLKKEALAVTIADQSIFDICELAIGESSAFFSSLEKKLTKREQTIARQILKEIRERLVFLADVGLEYLTLNRSASTLSGGEAQRIRLATQIGSHLVGVVYILDEPSIGLHQRDNERLIKTLHRLRDLGNTVIVVEHDRETIVAADWVVDVGPGAGKHGGEIIFEGTPDQMKRDKKSVTGLYLSGKKEIPVPKKFRKGNGKHLSILGASEFNLKNLDINIPLGKFVCITGVSGSGKSTLMEEILHKALAKHFYRAKELPGKHKKITGIEHIDKVVNIDQSPIGRTPRSNPATYTGVFTYIRDLFSATPEAKMRGYKPGRFSFNVKGGRCEACQGDGLVRIEMHFLPDVYVECDECKGRRYNQQALDIHYRGKNIAEALKMTVEEALDFFRNIPPLRNKLEILRDVGLGYIELGQPATTLSGGEAQRIKLATELSRRSTGKTLYILDEPTTGLHFEDVKKLLGVLERLVDSGNTVLVIEHNLDVIKSADWVVDLGPEGGDKGGELVAAGTPRDVAKVTRSYTGKFLKPLMK